MKLRSSIIIVILIISVIGLYGLKKVNNSKQVAGVKTQRPSYSSNNIKVIPTGAGNINDPLTWSTYVFNNEWQVQFPPKWVAKTRLAKDGVNFITPGYEQDDDNSAPYTYGETEVNVSYTIFNQNDTSDMQHVHEGSQFPSEDNSVTLVATNIKKFQINGNPALEFDYYQTRFTSFIRTKIEIQKGNNMYRFNAAYTDKKGKMIFEKMMNTFQVVNIVNP